MTAYHTKQLCQLDNVATAGPEFASFSFKETATVHGAIDDRNYGTT